MGFDPKSNLGNGGFSGKGFTCKTYTKWSNLTRKNHKNIMIHQPNKSNPGKPDTSQKTKNQNI